MDNKIDEYEYKNTVKGVIMTKLINGKIRSLFLFSILVKGIRKKLIS